MRGGRGGYNNTRGGYYNNSYRVQTSNRQGGNRYNNNNDNHYNNNSGNNRYSGPQGNNYYDNRSRDKFNNSTNSTGRYESGHKRSYDSSRDRRDDRKRPRQDDYRRTTSNNTGRNDRPMSSSQQLPSSSSSSNYHRSSTGANSSTYRPRDSSTSGNRHHRDSPMGPPKRAPIRTVTGNNYIARSRGSLSGRGMRTTIRGVGSNMRIIRNTRESADLRIMRKKLLYAQQKDRARVLKIQKLTSSLRRRRQDRNDSKSKSPGQSSKNDSDSSEEDNDDDDGKNKEKKENDDNEDEESDAEVTKKSTPSKRNVKSEATASADDNDDDEQEEGDVNEKVEEKTGVKTEKNDKSSNDKDNAENDADVNNEDGEKGKEKISVLKVSADSKSGKKKDKSSDDKEKSAKKSGTTKKELIDKKKDNDSDDETGDKKTRANSSRYREDEHSVQRKRAFIKLTCIHCHTKCVTFKEYSYHLNSRTHNNALRQVALRQRADLLRLRARQRTAQREIEENSKEQYESRYCRLCRLAYRQPKAQHQMSDHHKTIKKFLMPYCSSCHLAFKNSMLYEVHRCSLDHIRNKARNQDSDSDNSADEREIDLNKFLTVDSVGEIDNDMDADVDALLQESEAAQNADDDEAKKRSLVGAKFITPIEAFYCELCNHYSAKVGDDTLDTYSKKHCMQRTHIKAYLRHKDEEERAAKKSTKKSKDANKSDKDETVVKGENEHAEGDEADTTTQNMDVNEEDECTDVEYEEGDVDHVNDEKLWEEVDKDLGDLLAEVEPLGREDEEEDESVLNIDIESEKPKPKEAKDANKDGKEVNGKKEEADVAKEEEAKPATPTKPTPPAAPKATAAATKSVKAKPQPQRKAVVSIKRTKAATAAQK